MRLAKPINDAADRHEQCRGHRGVSDEVIHRACQPRPVGQPGAANHVADLRDDEVTGNHLQVGLCQREERTHHDRDGREIKHDGLDAGGVGDVVERVHREHDAEHRVNGDLRGEGGKHRRAGGGRVGVGVGQPAVEREESHLHPDAKQDQHEADKQRLRWVKCWNDPR